MRHHCTFRADPTPLQRLALVLFAILQLVAPTWHVCEMSGNCDDCPSHMASSSSVASLNLQCHVQPATKTKFACCRAKPNQTVWKDRAEPFDGTCLAKELLAMPSSLVSPFDLQLLFTPRLATVFPRPKYFQAASLPQPPARGPPSTSVLLLVCH